jgi:hypothetical protein
MIDLRLINLQEGDSQSDVANKLNYNFNQILSAGGGAYGPIGIDGAVGGFGLIGATGPAGFQGQRGNFWFVQSSEPQTGSAGATAGDYWVNLSNDCEVFQYTLTSGSYSWVSQGFLLAQSGVFEIASSITGLTSGSPSQSYVIALPDPAEKTLILTGASGPSVKNPQLSKVIIGNGGTSGYPLLEFSKTDYQSSSYFNSLAPKIKWGSSTASNAEAYGLNLETRGGIIFNTSYFSLSGENIVFTSAGLTGSFSGDVNYTSATGDFRFSSANLSINAANAIWDQVGFTGPIRFSLSVNSAGVTPRNTLLLQDGITYNRTSNYVTGQNLLKVNYKGTASYSVYGPYLGSDNNFYLADSDGNNKFAKKTSGYFPNPKTVSSYNNTGLYAWTGKITGTQPVYSVGAATSTTTSTYLMRHQIGEFFHPDVFTGSPGSTGPQALSVFIPNSASSAKTGYGYLVQSGETMTFRVNSTSSGYGFNTIILDAPNSNDPTSSFGTLTSGVKKQAVLLGDLVDSGGSESVYADQFEFNIVRVNSLNEWKVYFKAWGGNIKNYTSTDGGILCGCVSTTS